MYVDLFQTPTMKRSLPRFDAALLSQPVEAQDAEVDSSADAQASSAQETDAEEPNLIEQMANKLRGRLRRRLAAPKQ